MPDEKPNTALAPAPKAESRDASIWVIPTEPEPKVVMWERDDEHPDGEAFVYGGTPAHVGRTARVEALLKTGVLRECSGREVADHERFHKERQDQVQRQHAERIATALGRLG